MSGEHLWSAWIGKLFADYKGIYSFRTGISEQTTNRWKSRSIDMKAHVVCEGCNNTWMSDLEQQARTTMKDMIRNAGWVSLLPIGISSIAAFAFKTAVVADHITPNRHPFFSHSAREQFASTRQIPKHVQIWLGAFRGEHLLSGRYTSHYAKIRSTRFKSFEFYVFTYVAGFLALQLTAWRWASIAKKPRFIPQLTQHTNWARASVPLWPGTGIPVVWPPVDHLDDKSLRLFAERWARLETGQ
jgi:hypothetical protein